MKQLFTFIAIVMYCSTTSAQNQTDTIRVGNMTIIKKGDKKTTEKNEAGMVNTATPADTAGAVEKTDTLRIGNMVIIRDGNNKDKGSDEDRKWRYWGRKNDKPGNVSTNWFILDLGFSNYVNNTTDYSSGGYLYNRAGAAPLGESDFELSTGKSINVNIWFFMQRLNLIKHHVHLKYGLGIELNNYRYNSQISYLKENPFVSGVAPAPTIIRDSISFKKNKLATDYVTVPLMLSYSANPNNQHRGFSISLGVSAGYLYSQRNKQVSENRGKEKTKGGIGVEQFKFSYVGEIGLGPVRLYGSYSPNSLFKNQLDMRPYTLGIRLSNW
ncbi:MAG TPA: outer membrane beta-barrel protein [Ferruginibacter sp.]|nr:outer membrane beta-barrel protein [Ferruginibacter sp.]HPH91023.1 outer membrane beta-barrel protein [Ferruginibacter sp.]